MSDEQSGIWNEGLTGMLRPISDLKLDPKNARRHNAKNLMAIRHSLMKFGQQTPIVVLSDGTVIRGNGTLQAAQELEWTHIAALEFDSEDEAKARGYAIADNRTAELADWDLPNLQQDLVALQGSAVQFEDVGLFPGDVEKLFKGFRAVPDVQRDVLEAPVATP